MGSKIPQTISHNHIKIKGIKIKGQKHKNTKSTQFVNQFASVISAKFQLFLGLNC